MNRAFRCASMALAGGLFLLPGAEAAIPNESAPTASSWPMFRGGPALLGVTAVKLPKDIALLWSFKTQGPVKSSAAIVDGRVFIGSDDGHLYAVDLKTGVKVWDFKTDAAVESSPLVLNGTVFFGSTDASLYAVDAVSGKLRWKYTTGDKILGAPNWVKSPKGDATWILIGSYDFKLHCLDAVTGKSNWVYESSNYINGSPAASNGRTVFGGCDELLHVISLADGQQIKEVEAGAPIAASVALDQNRAYFGHYENAFLCVDIEKGTNLWSFRDRNFPYFSSPALTSDRVVFGGRDKQLHCLRREDGHPLWTFSTRGKVDSSPVICDDRIVVGSDDGRLYVVALADGAEIWSYEIGQPVGSSPAVVENRIVVGCEDGSVYAFGAPVTKAQK